MSSNTTNHVRLVKLTLKYEFYHHEHVTLKIWFHSDTKKATENINNPTILTLSKIKPNIIPKNIGGLLFSSADHMKIYLHSSVATIFCQTRK